MYWIRQGKILEQTADHSRVEELYQQGIITAEQKLRHPQRNIVTQCIGSPKKPPKPTISQKTPLSPEDVLLLCSDGLWGQLPEDQLAAGLIQNNIEDALEKLAHDAELNGFPRSDNISAVAFHWLSNEKSSSAAYKPLLDDLDDLNDGLDAMRKTLDEIEKDIN